jgi:hypothetical protein
VYKRQQNTFPFVLLLAPIHFGPLWKKWASKVTRWTQMNDIQRLSYFQVLVGATP